MIKYVQAKTIDYDRIKELLNQSVQAHIFTNNGPVKQQLEHFLEKLFNLPSNRRVACASNGTAALYILISLFEKAAKRPLRWGTCAFNFPATSVNRLQTEIFDIEWGSKPFNSYKIPLDVLDRFDGIIIPTLFGTVPSNLEELDQLCKDKSKILILDNASSPLGFKKSPGDPNKGKGLNEFGTACIGSMHHTKYLGFSEAGFAVVSSALYDEFNSLTNFGFSDDRKFNSYATNAKLSDVSAAFVLSHVENYAQESHQNFQKKYIDAISKIKGAEVFNLPDDSWSLVYGNMPVVFEKPVSHLVFRDVGIEANKYYKPLASLPRSQDLFDRIINLPLHSTLTDYEMDLILKKIEIEAK